MSDCFPTLPLLQLMLYGITTHYNNNSPATTTSTSMSITSNGGGGGDGLTVPAPSAASADQSPGRKTKEGRRSWTSKNKPYMCKEIGCNKSYFFVHDLRRHERQKHPDRPLTGTPGPKPGGVSAGPELPLDFSAASPINIIPEHCSDSPINGTSSDTET